MQAEGDVVPLPLTEEQAPPDFAAFFAEEHRGLVVRADHLPLHGTILARGPFTEDLDLKVKLGSEGTWSSCRSRTRPTRSSSRSPSSPVGSQVGIRTPDRPS